MAGKDPGVAGLLADILKTHGLRIGAASAVLEPTQFLSTGNLAIDYVAGGGLPIGRTTELYGPPSSGKTTSALQTAALLQAEIIANDLDTHILYLDYEHALDEDYTAALGLDIEHPSFLLARPYSLEQGAQAALSLIDAGTIALSIWDSVAAMAPIARLEGEFDQRTAAMNRARLMSGLLLQLTPQLAKHASTAVFINHAVESIEMSGRPGLPPRVDSPGGKGLKFYASLRLQYMPMGMTKSKDIDPLSGDSINRDVATHIKIKCTKNRCAQPGRVGEARITYGHGFDTTWSALQVLLYHKVIRKDGAWYRFTEPLEAPWMQTAAGKASIQGESAVLRAAREHPEWMDALIGAATDLIDDDDDRGRTQDATVGDPMS